MYKFLDSDQVPLEFIQPHGKTLCLEIYIHVHFIWNMEDLPLQWITSITVSIYRKSNKTDVIVMKEYHPYQLHTKLYPTFFSYG
jgi:hypothetical protein